MHTRTSPCCGWNGCRNQLTGSATHCHLPRHDGPPPPDRKLATARSRRIRKLLASDIGASVVTRKYQYAGDEKSDVCWLDGPSEGHVRQLLTAHGLRDDEFLLHRYLTNEYLLAAAMAVQFDHLDTDSWLDRGARVLTAAVAGSEMHLRRRLRAERGWFPWADADLATTLTLASPSHRLDLRVGSHLAIAMAAVRCLDETCGLTRSQALLYVQCRNQGHDEVASADLATLLDTEAA